MTGTAESEVGRWKLGTGDWELDTRGEAAERTELRAEQVRRVIMAHGVSLIQFMTYRNFGLHVDKLFRDYSGESLRLMVTDAIARWSSYGCDQAILGSICAQVFGLNMGCKP